MFRLWITPLLLLAALIGQASGAVVSNTGLSLSITVTINPASLPATITDAITGDANGDGYLDRLTLTFSRPVNVVDGGGSGDGFNAITLNGGYVIANQDYSASNVTFLVLSLIPGAVPDTGVIVSPTYHTGFSSTIANVSNGQVMADTTSAVGSDGAPPVFIGLAPATGAVVADTRLSFVLSEPLVSGSAQWAWFGGNADPTPHVQALSGSELAQGAHTDITIANNPTLVAGGIYNLSLSGLDAAGNSAIVATSAGVSYQPGKRPRIISEAPLWAVTGQPWTYEVVVDTRELRPSHVLNPADTLTFVLSTAPPGVTITKTGLTTARVHWPAALGTGSHHPVIITVTDSVSGTSDQQEVLLYVVAVPSAGG